ncbi:hypothetical protein [Burkholderia sp. BCC1998]|uniref:hypothetical protein n=1 Tax=Burkholderia sp. BCC1998 TaxID=2817447 RepID=UPI002AB66136|nr:hypothetical protein [Burkholderia sp. BCC1998]
MPFGAIAGGLAAGIGGSLVSGMMSPGTSGGGGGSYYVPSGLPQADLGWQNLQAQASQNQAAISNLMPYYQQALQNGYASSNLYGPAYLQHAIDAAGQYGNVGSALTNLGNMDLATQQQLLGAGQNVFNLGLDPQSALYARTQQQVQDQVNANNSMYGLGQSAAGAGVANQAMSNFNIDWQNQQLQRALSGLQGYAGAANTAGSYGQAGANALSQAPQYTLLAGSLPYDTSNSIAAYPGSLAATFASQVEQGPLSSAQSLQGQIIPYLNYGAGAQSVPFQAQAQGAGALGSLVSQGISGLGNSIQNAGGFGNFFNGTTGSFGGGDFSGAFTSSPYYSGGGNSYGFTM